MRKEKLELEKIRGCIKAPQINTNKEIESWNCFDIANCYSYALGMFVDIDALEPGEISKLELKRGYSDEEILERVTMDLELLGLEISASSLEEEIADENSWKIAIMNTGLSNGSFYDFHFLKQGVNMKWYHKCPYEQFPSNYDYRDREINNPETAVFAFGYHLVAYIMVSLKRQNV